MEPIPSSCKTFSVWAGLLQTLLPINAKISIEIPDAFDECETADARKILARLHPDATIREKDRLRIDLWQDCKEDYAMSQMHTEEDISHLYPCDAQRRFVKLHARN